MRWARRHLDIPWPGGGPRWHLIVNSTTGALVGACRRAVLPPFELVSEIPADKRCHTCDGRVPAAAIDAQTTESPRGTPRALQATMGDKRRELLALRAIVVSSRSALHKHPEDHERINDRVTELLAGLEEAVIRDGADADVLAGLDRARRDAGE